MVGTIDTNNDDPTATSDGAAETTELHAESARRAHERITLMAHINDVGFDAAMESFIHIVSSVTPGVTAADHNARNATLLRALTSLLFDDDPTVLAAIERLLASSDSANSTYVKCDYCACRLPWGNEGIRCCQCPIMVDVCGTCMTTTTEIACPLHQAAGDARNDIERYAEQQRVWEFYRIVTRHAARLLTHVAGADRVNQ
jgi:hypothetical protein